jgi:thioredoxin-related protein
VIKIWKKLLFVITAAVMLLAGLNNWAAKPIQSPGFSDKPLASPVKSPAWFKLSFLELLDDVEEAKKAGKKGVILYFGQKFCPYCKAFIKNNFGKRDIVQYTRKNFDVIELDVKGNRLVTDISGFVLPENEFSVKYKANFTPTIIFMGLDGKHLLKLVGYQSPYRFMAALEFIADKHYLKGDFRAFLKQVNVLVKPEKGKLSKRSFYMNKPYILTRNRIRAQRPLLVVFEQRDCYACDVLHSGVFSNRKILHRLKDFDVVQIDIWSGSKLISPAGKPVSSIAWAEKLNISYTPTMVFFDRSGKEIIRVESIIYFNRLAGVLKYVSSGAFKKYKTYLQWRARRGKLP